VREIKVKKRVIIQYSITVYFHEGCSCLGIRKFNLSAKWKDDIKE